MPSARKRRRPLPEFCDGRVSSPTTVTKLIEASGSMALFPLVRFSSSSHQLLFLLVEFNEAQARPGGLPSCQPPQTPPRSLLYVIFLGRTLQKTPDTVTAVRSATGSACICWAEALTVATRDLRGEQRRQRSPSWAGMPRGRRY